MNKRDDGKSGRELKPSVEAFLVRMVWLAGPVIVVGLLKLFGAAGQLFDVLDVVLIFYVFSGLFLAVWLNSMRLKFFRASLIITDFFGHEKVYAWKLMDHPAIETNSRWLLPSWQVFSFDYQDEGMVKYRLSELADEDRQEALSLLRANFPDIPEIIF